MTDRYHQLTAQQHRTEEREGSHYGRWSHSYSKYHCDKCDYVSEEFFDSFSSSAAASQHKQNAEQKHNVSFILEMLSHIVDQIS